MFNLENSIEVLRLLINGEITGSDDRIILLNKDFAENQINEKIQIVTIILNNIWRDYIENYSNKFELQFVRINEKNHFKVKSGTKFIQLMPFKGFIVSDNSVSLDTYMITFKAPPNYFICNYDKNTLSALILRVIQQFTNQINSLFSWINLTDISIKNPIKIVIEGDIWGREMLNTNNNEFDLSFGQLIGVGICLN